LVGLGTRLPWRVQGLGGLLYVLMLLQYVFLYLMPQAGLPLLRRCTRSTRWRCLG